MTHGTTFPVDPVPSSYWSQSNINAQLGAHSLKRLLGGAQGTTSYVQDPTTVAIRHNNYEHKRSSFRRWRAKRNNCGEEKINLKTNESEKGEERKMKMQRRLQETTDEEDRARLEEQKEEKRMWTENKQRKMTKKETTRGRRMENERRNEKRISKSTG